MHYNYFRILSVDGLQTRNPSTEILDLPDVEFTDPTSTLAYLRIEFVYGSYTPSEHFNCSKVFDQIVFTREIKLL